MAFNHVGNCSCPVGCCDCDVVSEKTTRVYINLRTARLFLFTSTTPMWDHWFSGGLKPDGKKTPVYKFEWISDL